MCGPAALVPRPCVPRLVGMLVFLSLLSLLVFATASASSAVDRTERAKERLLQKAEAAMGGDPLALASMVGKIDAWSAESVREIPEDLVMRPDMSEEEYRERKEEMKWARVKIDRKKRSIEQAIKAYSKGTPLPGYDDPAEDKDPTEAEDPAEEQPKPEEEQHSASLSDLDPHFPAVEEEEL
jgi:hypothetical protein